MMLPPVRGGNKGRVNPGDEEMTVKRIRTGLGALLFVFLIGGVQACTESPTAPSGDDDTRECWWVDGILHCIG